MVREIKKPGKISSDGRASSEKRKKEQSRPPENRKKNTKKSGKKQSKKAKREKERNRPPEARKKKTAGVTGSRRSRNSGFQWAPAATIGIFGMSASLLWQSFTNMFPSLPVVATTAGMGTVGSIGILQAVRSNIESRKQEKKKGKGHKS